MRRFGFIDLLFFLVLTVPVFSAEKTNILFLFADDMRADTIAAHGNPHIQTHHIDSLVKAGFSFRRNYIFGGNSIAVCIPSRAMLMTGKTWFDGDVQSLDGQVLLPQWLGEHGYETFATGKWHNGQPSWRRAFQSGKSIMFGGMSDHTKVPVRDLVNGTLTDERIESKFSSELFADAAIEFLKQHDKQKPFFAYVAFTAPHDPRQPPNSHCKLYESKKPPLPKNFLPQHPFDNGMVKNLRDENLGAWPRTESIIRDQLAEYYGMITHMDEQIGRILYALKEQGEFDHTLIIFSSDNGLALGSHGLLGKQSVYEHSMQVPLIIVGPGIPKDQTTHALTYLMDLFPTLCDYTGISTPDGLRGQSLKPLWRGESKSLRETIFLPFQKLQRAVCDERWKLVAYPEIGHWQLFDLKNDPDELVNLIDDPTNVSHVKRLMISMKEWQAQLGDDLDLPEGNRSPEPLDLSNQKRVPDKWQPDWIVKKYFDSESR